MCCFNFKLWLKMKEPRQAIAAARLHARSRPLAGGGALA
jgi:hypothetical protein